MASIRLASDLQQDSIVDGPGIRMVLWTQGCLHQCPGCHNPHTHDLNGGKLYDVDTIISEMRESRLQSGLTLSGGEPFLQAEALLPIVKAAKQMHLNIWAYSGFTYEELWNDPVKKKLLMELDVLVDGKFIQDQKDHRLVFKGSKNQRIIDVKRSIEEGYVILSSYDDKNQF
ncbi:anaerobic ribonucleoside-triphosphate reductase activating protein [[Eubacterium] hominis]|uniref:anaerobic ribonucleoside-triphosphate reductase activating protein n=1 Tax=[Eubacterium] hominis TaxID=2764325 RepID=UPI003A4D5E5D